jgi:putative membrane-bound dehydrogenase-like protein
MKMMHAFFRVLLAAILAVSLPILAADTPAGIKPAGADGTPLNLDFEDGTLKDWKATGNAFDKQPIEGDRVAKRRPDMRSNHAGRYWIGTYEIHGDKAQGTLTSVPFKVTHPWAAFLVAGGPYEETRVEIVRADNQQVIFKTAGFDGEQFKKTNNASETLRAVAVDLQAHLGKEIFIRIVDQHTGHWGHINFDDFKFYASKPSFPAPAGPAKPMVDDMPPLDQVAHAGLSPEEAVKAMTLPPGFKATLFAGEPDIRQPIAFALDDRGRVWVAEGHTYPRRAPEGQGKDQILIFEDTNGDGSFNKRTVFMENLNLVSGLEVGFGGVWVGAAPYLMFIPDRDGDDKPDGEPEILLDGWGWQDTHETLNTFAWGPDGWLYGCHGVFTHSNVGKPGASDSDRKRINAGIWRYHPTRHAFEVFAEGTSNPWGIDFDDNGQAIIEACVIPHLFHIIQGARYHRQSGQHFNPHTYADIRTIADHVHYAGTRGPHAGNARSDAAGGGHAHAGLMIYLGDTWPEQYRGQAFMYNIHGQRINMDILERKGSGFVGRHGPDFLHFNDKWSQALNMRYDQNGSMYVIDWYDKNQCHHNDPNGHDRSNGRIYKVAYGDTQWTPVDLQKKNSAELVELQLHRNDWYVRHARRILQERGPDPKVHAALGKILNENSDRSRKLRALWALHATGGLTEQTALAQLKSGHEYVRAWAIQLLAENNHPSQPALDEFARMAREDDSQVVRLYLASALQRTPLENRIEILQALVAHADDINDHNLPLMYWYAAEPVVGQDTAKAVALLGKTKIPLLREYITRRMTSAVKTAAN